MPTLTNLVLVVALVACSKRDDKKPAASSDPWASSATAGEPPPASDPWATSPTAVAEPAQPTPDPAQPTPEPAPASSLAGTYQCQTLRYGTLVNGMYQTAYVPSAMGTFEIAADGSYRSASYPDKGNGQARVDGTTVTFEDGPYAGYVGELGSTSSGAHIRFDGATPSKAPAPSIHFNDHVCYRR